MKQKKRTDCVKREKHIAISLNEKEYAMIDAYMKKYKIGNRTRWVRETLLSFVLKNLDQDYPTLFDENEMRR